MIHATTVDAEEVAQFSRLAAHWWDEHGPFAPLHALNPARVEYIVSRIQDSGFGGQNILNPESRPLSTLNILDIGCGGGLLSEALARLGARVTAIDASAENIAAAQAHAAESGLNIDYRHTTAEDLLITNHQSLITYDVVTALEIVEHVANPAAFVQAACALAKPGGLIIFSTLNRTLKAYCLAIFGAEYALRLLPRGTHDWQKFLKPSELAALVEQSGAKVEDITGLTYNPLTRASRLNPRDLSVNYLLCAQKLTMPTPMI